MQIKSGIDIIEVGRIKDSIDETGKDFKNRVYTENEIQYCESKKKNKYQSYAARFAVKEATFKAVSTLIKDKYSISWKNIETTNDKTGKASFSEAHSCQIINPGAEQSPSSFLSQPFCARAS